VCVSLLSDATGWPSSCVGTRVEFQGLNGRCKRRGVDIVSGARFVEGEDSDRACHDGLNELFATHCSPPSPVADVIASISMNEEKLEAATQMEWHFFSLSLLVGGLSGNPFKFTVSLGSCGSGCDP
jgi:hypothetical protein